MGRSRMGSRRPPSRIIGGLQQGTQLTHTSSSSNKSTGINRSTPTSRTQRMGFRGRGWCWRLQPPGRGAIAGHQRSWWRSGRSMRGRGRRPSSRRRSEWSRDVGWRGWRGDRLGSWELLVGRVAEGDQGQGARVSCAGPQGGEGGRHAGGQRCRSPDPCLPCFDPGPKTAL